MKNFIKELQWRGMLHDKQEPWLKIRPLLY